MNVYSVGPEQVFRAVADAYANNDADGVLSHFADDARIIGSLRHETWGDKTDWSDYLRRELEDFSVLEHRLASADFGGLESVATSESLAIFSQEVGLKGKVRGRQFAHDGRWTCVLRDEGGDWKIVFSQFSLSLT